MDREQKMEVVDPVELVCGGNLSQTTLMIVVKEKCLSGNLRGSDGKSSARKPLF